MITNYAKIFQVLRSAVAEGNPILKYIVPGALVAIAAYLMLGRSDGPVQIDKTAVPPALEKMAMPGVEMPGQVTKNPRWPQRHIERRDR